MTLGQRLKSVKTLLAPPRGLPGNRRKYGQASRTAVGRQPVHQKRHVEIGCAGHKWCKQLAQLAAQYFPSLTPFSGRAE
jgi:hypothetical protein